jgi:hypothetical protein
MSIKKLVAVTDLVPDRLIHLPSVNSLFPETLESLKLALLPRPISWGKSAALAPRPSSGRRRTHILGLKPSWQVFSSYAILKTIRRPTEN